MRDFDSVYNKIKNYSEMTRSESEFLYDSIVDLKPKKILEIGVSSGASSAVILEAIKNNSDSVLYSVDLMDTYYKNNKKQTGFIVYEAFKEYLNRYKLYTNCTIADCIEQIGSDIDFVFLDAAHGIPGEVLDFLVVLPYCKKNATFVVHDINIQAIQEKPTLSLAPKMLMMAVDADKAYPQISEHQIFNIGKFTIKENTFASIENVFSALLSRWVRPMSLAQYHKFAEILSQHYDEHLVKYFEIASTKFRYETVTETPKTKVIKKIIRLLQKI